jgi:hypothetical protein
MIPADIPKPLKEDGKTAEMKAEAGAGTSMMMTTAMTATTGAAGMTTMKEAKAMADGSEIPAATQKQLKGAGKTVAMKAEAVEEDINPTTMTTATTAAGTIIIRTRAMADGSVIPAAMQKQLRKAGKTGVMIAATAEAETGAGTSTMMMTVTTVAEAAETTTMKEAVDRADGSAIPAAMPKQLKGAGKTAATKAEAGVEGTSMMMTTTATIAAEATARDAAMAGGSVIPKGIPKPEEAIAATAEMTTMIINQQS